MRGLFGFGKSSKSGGLGGQSSLLDKLSAQRFTYSITIHNLQPWPAGNRAVAIGWQRGKKKRGATRSVYASTAPGRLGNVVRFNEKFELTATLYKAPTGTSMPSTAQLGPFKKKCLILAVLEMDNRTQATAALGRVVIDLAEFAAIENQETRAFMVSCNKHIHAAVGEPQLLITIRTSWKKSSAGAGGQDAGYDEAGSMSTDTTGSRMTTNLSSFLRHKYSGKGPATANEEQDLGGFDGGFGSNRNMNGAMSKGGSSGMGTIQEGQDEPDSPPSSTAARPPVPRGPLYSQHSDENTNGGSAGGGMMSLRARHAAAGPPLPTSQPQQQAGYPGVGGAVGNATRGMASLGLNGNGASYSQQPATPSPPSTAAQLMPMPGIDNDSVVLARHSGISTPPQPARSGHLFGGLGLASAAAGLTFDSMQQELLAVSATEVVVHMARTAAAASRRPQRAAHASARRLARTLTCMSQTQAPAFGSHVLKLVAGLVESSSGDVSALAFWWSNAAHLRGLLQGGVLTGATPPGLTDPLMPQILGVERLAFDRLLSHLWDEVLLPAVAGDSAVQATSTSGAPGAGGGMRVAPAASAQSVKPSLSTKRAVQEAAVKRWFEGLDQVKRRLARLAAVPAQPAQGAGSVAQDGHVPLLRSQLLLQCLRRLDALLFFNLLSPGEPLGSQLLADYDPSCSLWGAPGRPCPVLDDSQLPFTRGLLTFGVGMSVKMTVTRLQQWAASDPSLSETLQSSASMAPGSMSMSGVAPGGAQLLLFPLLRATADLLMMPKEMLLEASIRRDAGQALSGRTMVHILESFAPDEYAADAIPPEVLRMLKEEAAAGAVGGVPLLGGRPPLADLSMPYRPPSEEVLYAKVSSGAEPGLEYDADSEDELAALSTQAALPGTAGRFKLLHDLWINGLTGGMGGSGRMRTAPSVGSSTSHTPNT